MVTHVLPNSKIIWRWYTKERRSFWTLLLYVLDKRCTKDMFADSNLCICNRKVLSVMIYSVFVCLSRCVIYSSLFVILPTLAVDEILCSSTFTTVPIISLIISVTYDIENWDWYQEWENPDDIRGFRVCSSLKKLVLENHYLVNRRAVCSSDIVSILTWIHTGQVGALPKLNQNQKLLWRHRFDFYDNFKRNHCDVRFRIFMVM